MTDTEREMRLEIERLLDERVIVQGKLDRVEAELAWYRANYVKAYELLGELVDVSQNLVKVARNQNDNLSKAVQTMNGGWKWW